MRGSQRPRSPRSAATEDGTDAIDGRKVDVVIGLPEGGERRVRFFPGIVPVVPPPPGFWGERFTGFPVFQPPRIAGAAGDGGSPYQSRQGRSIFCWGTLSHDD